MRIHGDKNRKMDMKNKRIVVNLVALHGGGPAYSYEMTRGFAENGCEVLAILSPKMDNYQQWKTIPGIRIINVSGYSNKFNFIIGTAKFLIAEKRRVIREIKAFQPDYVYIPFMSFWTELVQLSLKGYPVLFTMHDVYPHDDKKNFVWRSSERIAKKADYIIILSEIFRQEIKKNYGLKDERIIVVPHGNYFKGNVVKSNDDGKVHFVFYGRITEYKGLGVLADAYAPISEKYPNVHLLVAGNGDFSPYREKYMSIDPNKVQIINRWIDDSEVEGFFSFPRSVCVLPYINATQSGVIPLAMHCRSLVLTTNCSGLVEQVEDGKTGFIISANDAEALKQKMEYIINNWDEVSSIAEAGYEHIESLSWKNIVGKIVEMI